MALLDASGEKDIAHASDGRLEWGSGWSMKCGKEMGFHGKTSGLHIRMA
jgi:hypothetical protein